jgi:thiamine pyrophosphate-dependent acetolactate synthase large subunit-like protein
MSLRPDDGSRLETIKRHRLNILIVVMNDGAYGSEVHKFRSVRNAGRRARCSATADFAGIARGFGLAGRTFKKLDNLPKALAGCGRTECIGTQ